MNVNLTLSKDLFIPKSLPLMYDYTHRFEVWCGSAGSGKSFSISQKIILRCLRQKIRVLICRKYGTTIRNTVFKQVKDVLTQWKIIQFVKVRETDFNIMFPNGSEIIFMGLDEETKLLSLSNISVVWVEEAFEVEKEMVEQLNLRLRGGEANSQIILSFNPISKDHWLYDFCVENPPEGLVFLHSTYKDNPFLDAEYVKSIEDLKSRNPSKWKVYGLGEWGINTDLLVFRNWRVEEFDVAELAKKGLEQRNGVDFGWIDPSTCARAFYDAANNKIYVFDEIYASGLQLDEFASRLKGLGLGRRNKIYCDSAEPRSIEYLKSQGFYAVPCIKGKDSVKARVLFLQNNEIIVHPKCVNMIKELSNFSYIEKNGKITEDMTHEYSHLCCDGLGYAFSDIDTKKTMTILDKKFLNL